MNYMVTDLIVFGQRAESNEICKCVHYRREHVWDGTKCGVCNCDAFDISDVSGGTIAEIMEAWNEANESQ
jgi:hypothetical protein